MLEYPAAMSSNGFKVAPVHAELPAEKLRWRCEASRLPFETTAQTEPREGFIGQERALRALKMGVELSAPGYNVFVCGLAGTSRGGTIARMIEELHPQTKTSLDRCYVNNFKIYKCPADSLSVNPGLQGLIKVRSYSMNCWMNVVGNEDRKSVV